MIKIRFLQLRSILLIWVFSAVNLFAPRKGWVICERGYDARDNAYHFYLYMKRNHPEVRVYYLIDQDSKDYPKVAEDVVQYKSLKNYWVLARSEKIVSTHYAYCLPDSTGKVFRFSGLYRKFYFLQHGIIKDDLLGLHREVAPMRLFVCGAQPEYEYVKEHFGHEASVVQYTGLARYDNLLDYKVKKQVLLMPTWRGFIKNENDFLQSQYYKRFQDLLNDERIAEVLDAYGFNLVFYPHYEIQKYIGHFSSENKRITVASFGEYDVQTLLKESAMLITDYSSVFFDFAYMKKPIIYYQFDKDDFFEKHYKRGYFDYETMGFGRVCTDVEQLAEEFEKLAGSHFVMPKQYADRTEQFFMLRDTSNCQRIYEAIIRG